ncbi:MAG: ribose-phosphate pyrophosphokinase [Rhodobacteraceae bacterium]|nr:ribose-phosphate pyrophosphokinase [Paracoccaceae bacterium]
MHPYNFPKLVKGSANPDLSSHIANCITAQSGKKTELLESRVESFNDKEIYVELYQNVRGEDIFILQSTSRPANDHLMEILIIADTLRRSSAQRITAVIPYFGYARQDRRTRARTPITAKLVANLISQAGVNRVLTMDLHSAQIQGFFDIPVDNLYASPIFEMDIMNLFKGRSDQLTVVSPDIGGVTRARELAQRLDVDLAVIDKRRSKPGEIAEMNVIGEVNNRICILVDDICDTAGTLCKGSDLLMENGALEVNAYITHGVLSNSAHTRINKSSLNSLVITDTIQYNFDPSTKSKIRVVSTAPLFSRAILNIADGTSVSSLFKTENVKWLFGNMDLPLFGQNN